MAEIQKRPTPEYKVKVKASSNIDRSFGSKEYRDTQTQVAKEKNKLAKRQLYLNLKNFRNTDYPV